MWIREADVPEALVDAQRRGDLVIFVGAGASRGAPSKLPDFRQLTAAVAADFGISVSADRLNEPDVLLGELDDNPDLDVHGRVATRLDQPTSRPNALHEAIVALAAAGPSVRIVTTNYDRHLSTELQSAGVHVQEYMAPALPMGDDFTGLVYLHGSVHQDPRHLVVTDTDFGRAYLRDGWATRFLGRMFTRFTVLFVGYSHNDVVMSYLARGLGRESSRYVLTSDPEGANWRRLRITPIGYPNDDGSHSALGDAIGNWASWISMGMLGHRQRVADLVSTAPPQVPEQVSYLEAIVADPEKVGLFTDQARGKAWLAWASMQPEFQRLFDPTAQATSCTRPLAYWLAEQVNADEESATQALSILQGAGGRLAPETWSALGHRLIGQDRPLPTWLGPWIVLLVQSDPGWVNSRVLEIVLVKSILPEERALSFLLLEHLTEPIARYRSSLGYSDPPHPEIRLRGDAYWLSKAWDDVFVPNLTAVAPQAIAVVDRQLRRAHRLLSTAHPDRSKWDSFSWMWPAIEQQPQAQPRGSANVLIQAGRDCIETLLTDNPDLGAGYLASWAATEVPLLQRLAVHGWSERTDVDATAKLNWLRTQNWLFEVGLRHEVFRLIQIAVADADTDAADALVAQAVSGPAGTADPDLRAYQAFNALSWINQHAPHLASARQALDDLQAQHPDFEPREHPDRTLSWIETTQPGAMPPTTADALHERIASDPATAVQDLMQYRDATSPIERPNWSGALSVLAETVSVHPSDGLRVLSSVDVDEPDLLSAVIHGWTGATLDRETAVGVLTRLGTLDLSGVTDDVAELLLARNQDTSDEAAWIRSTAAHDVAAAAWSALEEREVDTDRDDWLGQAINDPAGKLTEFHVNAVAAEWRAAGDTWSGLTQSDQLRLDDLVSSADHKAAMAEIILASKLHFFDAADRSWSEAHVLPLLEWADPARARRTWDGYLYWGRWNDHLLNVSLLSAYIQAAEHVALFPDDLRHRLCEHLAAIALVSDIHPIDNGWLTKFTSTVDVETRVNWIDQVSWLLERLPADVAESQWGRWMRQYWEDRLASVPAQLTKDEAGAMAAWILHLTDSITQAVDLATRNPAGLREHSAFLQNLTPARIQQNPAAWARLVTHLLRGTQRPFYDGHSLKEVVIGLKAQSTPVETNDIINEALRLGLNDAPTW